MATSLLELLPVGVLLVDPDGIITFANRAAGELLRVASATELVGDSVAALVPERLRVQHEALRRGFMHSPRARSMAANDDLTARRADGTEIPVEISLTPVDLHGEPQILVLMTDATERRSREAESRLHAVALSAAANGIAIVDRAGRFIWVNRAFTDLTGWDAEQVVGRSTRLLKSGQHDAAYYERMWSTLLAGEVWSGETVNLRRDGTPYVEEQTITPVRDRAGAITHFVAIKQDVTARRHASEDLERRLRELQLLNRLAVLATERLDPEGLIARATQEVREALCLEDFRIELAHPDGRRATGQSAAVGDGAKVRGGRLTLPLRVGDRSLGKLRADLTGRADAGQLRNVLATVASQLASALERLVLLEQLQHYALTDSLTGVANRRAFLLDLERERQRARRYGRGFSVGLFDLDHFKRVNDTRGHVVGDAVLAAVAERFGEAVRATDVVGRYGGEEFVVLMPETGAAAAVEVAERVRHAVREREIAIVDGDPVAITVSGGVASWRHGVDVEELISRADEAMYLAKRAGRDRVLSWEER